MWAPCSKPATRGRIAWARDIALQKQSLAPEARHRQRNCRQQGLGVRVARCFKQAALVGGFYNLTEVHHRDMGRNVFYDRQIVGNKDVSQIQPVLQVPQQIDDLRLN